MDAKAACSSGSAFSRERRGDRARSKRILKNFDIRAGGIDLQAFCCDQGLMTIKRFRRFYEKYCILTDWNIGVAKSSPAELTRLVADGWLGPVTWSPKASLLRSRADPFIWPLEADHRVIYEEIDHWRKRGQIRSLSLQQFARLQRSRQEIAQPYHLSYPFVVHFDGAWYCIPESARARGVDLYAWDPAEASWKLVRRLIDNIGILDATLFRYHDIWYLFGTTCGGVDAYDKLRIWWSESIEGQWRLHARNPAKVDLRSARSAGPFFQLDGRWYRPAQDCTTGYGSAVTINRLDVLTPSEFEETTVSRVQPDPNGPYPDGLHTLAVYGDKVLIDGKRVHFSAALLLMKAARRIVRLLDSALQKIA